MPIPTPDSWLALPEAKEHLNIPESVTTNDDELTVFLRRTERAMFNRVGHVKLRAIPISEYRSGGRSSVKVHTCPIGVVTEISVQGTVVPAADLDGPGAGWYLEDDVDEKVGIIRHTDRFPRGFVKVTYQPGRDPIPEDLELASVELLRHLWKTQRGAVTSRPGLRGEQQVDPPQAGPRGGERTSSGFTFPNRVMELIGPYIVPGVG